MSPTWTMRLYASPKRALRPTLRKHRARQPQSNRTKTGRRLELGGRPDLVPLLFAGVGVSGVPKPPVSGLLHAPIHLSAWRNCLENRNGFRIEAPTASERGQRRLDRPPFGAKNARSRSLRPFSKQFLEGLFSEVRPNGVL